MKRNSPALFFYLERVCEEIAAISHPADEELRFGSKGEVAKVEVEGIEKTEDEKLLEGPRLEGKGLDQAAIDALFD